MLRGAIPVVYNFPQNGEGWTILCAHGWVGQALYCILRLHFPSKKSSLQKIFGFVFLNLPHAREARGVPQNQWFSLLAAKENHSENDLVPILVTLRGIEPRFKP